MICVNENYSLAATKIKDLSNKAITIRVHIKKVAEVMTKIVSALMIKIKN